MITSAPGLGLQELQRSSQRLLFFLLLGWSFTGLENPSQAGVSWSGQGLFCCPLNWYCFAVQGLTAGIVQLQRCLCSHGHTLPRMGIMAGGTTMLPTATLVDTALGVHTWLLKAVFTVKMLVSTPNRILQAKAKAFWALSIAFRDVRPYQYFTARGWKFIAHSAGFVWVTH